MVDPHFDPDGFDSTEAYVGIAADIVSQLAPPPDPETTEYAEKAERAEFLVFTWLDTTTGGSTSSEGLSGISGSFTEWKSVQRIVSGAMGTFYTGGIAGAVKSYPIV